MSALQPLVFSPSERFDGNDGNWSTFIIRVGTPEQYFRVLPSPRIGEVMIPNWEGCEQSKGNRGNCADLRGVVNSSYSSGFQSNASTTWNSVGRYTTFIGSRWNYHAGVGYGRDSVGLMVQNSGGPTLDDQVVGLVDKYPYFTGFFGLRREAFNFTDYSTPHPSYITALKNSGQIPSLSFGYTAGAFYSESLVAYISLFIDRPENAFASLTLGGYDESRFQPTNNITFPFGGDEEQPMSLYLQNIMVKNTLNGTNSILRDEIYVSLDFTLPYLWLPVDACDRIAAVFQLRYDDTSRFYLAEEGFDTELMEKNAEFTFELGSSPDSAEAVSIVIPYIAFNHALSWPLYNGTTNITTKSTTRYFPMRRANDTQYTLGRAFMQEAYVIVDYERYNFSIHQASHSNPHEQKLVAIRATDDQTKAKIQGISRATIVVVTVGSILGLAILVVLVVLFCRRRRRSHERACLNNGQMHTAIELSGKADVHSQLVSAEVSEIRGLPVQELLHISRVEELSDNAFELPDTRSVSDGHRAKNGDEKVGGEMVATTEKG